MNKSLREQRRDYPLAIQTISGCQKMGADKRHKKSQRRTRWLVKRHHYSEYISDHLEPMTVLIIRHIFQVPLRRLLQ